MDELELETWGVKERGKRHMILRSESLDRKRIHHGIIWS